MRGAEEYLAEGFRHAFLRPHYIAADVVGKLVRWGVAFFAVAMAFGATLGRIPVSELDAVLLATGMNDVEAVVVTRRLASYSDLLAANLTMAVLVAAIAWYVIEAGSRGVLLGLAGRRSGRGAAVARAVLRQLASGLTRRLLLASAAIFIGLAAFGPVLAESGGESFAWTEGEGRWVAITGLLLIGLVAFSLTVLDTLARLGALELVGRSLPEVVVVSAFPALISASMWAAGLAFLAAEASREALGPLTILGIAIATATVTSAMFFVRCASVRRMYEELCS